MSDRTMRWLTRSLLVAGVVYLSLSVLVFVALGDPLILVHSAFATTAAAYAAARLGSNAETISEPAPVEQPITAIAS